MTPNPDSPAFIRHEIPNNASQSAQKMKGVYELLSANISALVWPLVNDNDLGLTYNTYTGGVTIDVSFTDVNHHTHHFSIISNGYSGNMVSCEYLFEGGIDAPAVFFRSYAEWLMLQLWKYEYDAELCRCGRGLKIPASIDVAYDIVSRMLDIVTNNIKPTDWFLSKEPIWKFYRTYYDLCKMLPMLQEEATKERWRNVKPEHFRLIRNESCALICLDYTDNANYTMQFRIGMTEDGFAEEFTDKFMDMFYKFENHARDQYSYEYFDAENRKFSEIANILLDIPFGWKALLFHGEDGFYISTYREYAFQKYCLMLDCIIPFKNKYEASVQFLSPEMLAQKEQLENALAIDLEIAEEQEPDLIFTHGHYIENPVEEDIPDECPF